MEASGIPCTVFTLLFIFIRDNNDLIPRLDEQNKDSCDRGIKTGI
jgi:hypothetical protein